MANIFSGLFGGGGGGSSAARLAKYKYDLEEDAKLKEYQQRNQNLIDSAPAYDAAIQDMIPERKRQMKLFQMMAGQETMGDKGMEGISTGFNQRGTTIADILKQDKSLDIANRKHQYKVDNPEAPIEPSKVATAKFYMGPDWEKLPIEERRLQAKDAWRDRQVVDVEDGFVDVYTGDKINKNLIQAGVDKARAKDISDGLISFYDDVDDTDNFLSTLSNSREDLKALHDTAEGATGWWSLAQSIPEGDANAWMRLRDTVVANIGLDKILSLKASSAQGATGLGALNEAELKMLQDHLGNLTQSQSPERLKQNIARMDKDLARLEKQKLRKLKQRRAWFNRNKVYMGQKASDPDLINPSMERLFEKDTYTPPPNTSTLGADEATIDALIKQYGGEE